MGYDIQDGALATANIIRNFVAADYLLAQNQFMTDQMYASAYKLQGIFRGTIIEEGYPRTDRQVLDSEQTAQARASLVDAGLPIGDRKIVLYAPTWKGLSFGNPNDDIDELVRHVKELESRIDSSKYCVLLKTHQIVHKLAAHRPDVKSILVPNEIPTNVILGLTDVLITDYSSIFFDFLSTGRPVLFFTPDLEDYEGTRGLYFEPNQWPGPLARTIAELAPHISRYATTGQLPPESVDRYRAAQQRFSSFDDGDATRRVVDIVFRGHRDGYRIRQGLPDGRTSILVYLGGMKPNGITTSVLNLLNSIDHSRFDVSAFFAQSKSPASIAKQRQIEYSVRQFPRVGGMNGSKLVHLLRHLEFRRGRINRHREEPMQDALWNDEWTRCFGDSRFDHVVDFSGYGPFWSVLLLHSPDAVRSIWLHNDLAEDAHRKVNGKKKMKRSLTSLFSLYPQFDHLVSVSPTLADINRRKLSAYASGESFVSALNTVDAAHILRGAAADLRESAIDPDTGETPAWVESLLKRDGSTVFVTVGRLSPEKNQARLIRAFAQVHAQHPLTKLFIVGDGPLHDDLKRLIDALGVADVRDPHRKAAEPALDHGGGGLLRVVQRLRGPAHGDSGGVGARRARGHGGLRLRAKRVAAEFRSRGAAKRRRSRARDERVPTRRSAAGHVRLRGLQPQGDPTVLRGHRNGVRRGRIVGLMGRFTFAQGNATKLASLPLYALGALACLVVPRRRGHWVFGSGTGVGEGALPLFLHARSADPRLKLTWLARDAAEVATAAGHGIRAVRKSSLRGLWATLSAQVVVVTHGFGDVNRFGVRDAFVVQLWHGIPLKLIHLDSPATLRTGMLLRLHRAARDAAPNVCARCCGDFADAGSLAGCGDQAAQRVRAAHRPSGRHR